MGSEMCIRDRHRRIARDSWFNHQRFRASAQGGTQNLLKARIASTAQTKVRGNVSFTARVLRDAIRREGSAHGGRRHSRFVKVLARDEFAKRSAHTGRAGGGVGVDAERAIRQRHGAHVQTKYPSASIPPTSRSPSGRYSSGTTITLSTSWRSIARRCSRCAWALSKRTPSDTGTRSWVD